METLPERLEHFGLLIGRLAVLVDLHETGGWLDPATNRAVWPFLWEPAKGVSNDYRLELAVRVSSVQSLPGPLEEPLHWHYQAEAGRLTLYWRPPFSKAGWTHRLELDLVGQTGKLELIQPANWPRIDYEELFPALLDKFIYTSLLNHLDGCLLHAASVSNSGRGLIFAGDSGTGKSTLSRLWQSFDGVQTLGLSDESSLLRQHDGHFWVYGTPWPSAAGVANSAGAPLERLYFLQHATENKVQRLEPQDAFFRLLQQSRLSFWDQQGVGATVEILLKLAETVLVYELGFRPDRTIIDYLQIQDGSPLNI